MLLITVLCVIFYPQVNKLTVYTQQQKTSLLEQISRRLEVTAIEQARIVDPNYEWIRYLDDLSPEIQNALKENALSAQSVGTSSLASDTNLVWEVTYNGKSFYHNYDENFNPDKAMLDVTFSSDGSRAFVSSTTTLPQLTLFNVQSRGIVNPNLVSSDEVYSNEFYYNVVLPKDFTIRFMVPEKLQANGGFIARSASALDVGRFVFFMGIGAVVCALFILFYRMDAEKKSGVFSRLIRLKAVFAWILLGALTVVMTGLVFLTSESLASGVLSEFFRSIGFSKNQASMCSASVGFMTWWFWLYLISITLLYVKYIFRYGLKRYLQEDTLTSAIIRRTEALISEQASKPLERWMLRRVVTLYVSGAGLILITCLLAAWIFSPLAALLLFIVEIIGIGILIYRMIYLMRSDYETTLAAANELIAGNFSYIQPKPAGMYQSLYNSLIDVKNEFQKALKDGLHSQNMKTQLISNVSHDLKTPVTGIKSYAELIGISDNLDDIHNYAKHLDNYTERLSRLINDLFDVARASSGDIQLSPAKIDLAALIEQVAAEWQEEFEKKKMQIILRLQPSSMVIVDPDKTVRMIENLFSNIRKYGMENTRIFITLACENSQVILKIKNISKTALDFSPDEITERFVRGDKSRHEPGAGLGLAIVKSFTEVQNGSFAIEIDGDVFTAVLCFPEVAADPATSQTSDGKEVLKLIESDPGEKSESESSVSADSEMHDSADLPAGMLKDSLLDPANPFNLPQTTPDGRPLPKMIGSAETKDFASVPADEDSKAEEKNADLQAKQTH